MSSLEEVQGLFLHSNFFTFYCNKDQERVLTTLKSPMYFFSSSPFLPEPSTVTHHPPSFMHSFKLTGYFCLSIALSSILKGAYQNVLSVKGAMTAEMQWGNIALGVSPPIPFSNFMDWGKTPNWIIQFSHLTNGDNNMYFRRIL